MNKSSDNRCKNNILFLDAIKLADKMLVMAKNGVPECEDDSCLMIYGIIRDCGYKIRRTLEQELLMDTARIEPFQVLH